MKGYTFKKFINRNIFHLTISSHHYRLFLKIFVNNVSTKVILNKVKKKTHKRDELAKIDNKVFIDLIFIKVYFIFILVILCINDRSSGCLSHSLRLHISGNLIPFTTHAHLLSTLWRLQSHDNKLNTAFDAGKPLFKCTTLIHFLISTHDLGRVDVCAAQPFNV